MNEVYRSEGGNPQWMSQHSVSQGFWSRSSDFPEDHWFVPLRNLLLKRAPSTVVCLKFVYKCRVLMEMLGRFWGHALRFFGEDDLQIKGEARGARVSRDDLDPESVTIPSSAILHWHMPKEDFCYEEAWERQSACFQFPPPHTEWRFWGPFPYRLTKVIEEGEGVWTYITFAYMLSFLSLDGMKQWKYKQSIGLDVFSRKGINLWLNHTLKSLGIFIARWL